MATTEHVLRLKATLDTNEVKQQLDSLNSSRQPERASQHAGGQQQQQLVMNGMLTGAVAGALLSSSRKQQAAALSRESKSFSKTLDTTMKAATGCIIKTFAQAKAELKTLDAEIA